MSGPIGGDREIGVSRHDEVHPLADQADGIR